MRRFWRLASARASEEQFVAALYRGILRREPDRTGLDYFVEALLSGRTHASVAEELISSDEFKTQTAYKLFAPPGHFYSPIVNTLEAERHLAALEGAPAPEFVPGIVIDRSQMVQTWHSLLPFLTTIPFHDSQKPPFRYAFDNPAYAWGDGSILHVMIRHHRPKRIIEIGSGWSSACTLDTVQEYLNNECDLTFVEPYPTLLLELIGEAASRVRIFNLPVQQMAMSFFDALEAGDILFIDSTHVMRTGSDVCFELFEILPRLASGVLVHFHDMFWPFEYPRSWVVDENRSWNEAIWRESVFNS